MALEQSTKEGESVVTRTFRTSAGADRIMYLVSILFGAKLNTSELDLTINRPSPLRLTSKNTGVPLALKEKTSCQS